MTLGLALSGGGSRAAAFHRGTLRALVELGLVEDIDVVSTVSGGSVFAAAWMSAQWRGRSVHQFLDDIAAELEHGFIGRSLGWRLVKLLMPRYTRSCLLAETLDLVLTHGMRLGDLPQRPVLCMNASVLNTGQVARFTKEGFSSTGIGPDTEPRGSNPIAPLPEFPLALAAIASAAFPIGLPPIVLVRGREIPNDWIGGSSERIALTDGGVIENLGVQTLLKSRRFGTWNLVISDAGLKDPGWESATIRTRIRGICLGLLSLPILERVLTVMSDKQDRHMRQAAFAEFERTWLIDALLGRVPEPNLTGYIDATNRAAAARKIVFVRVNQRFTDVLRNVPAWHCPQVAKPLSADHLLQAGYDIRFAHELYRKLGGDERVNQLNRIATGFSGLSRRDIDDLATHARWQVHMMHALYWRSRPTESS